MIFHFLVLKFYKYFLGLPWQSGTYDSMLPMKRTQVQSLVGEQRSQKPHGAASLKKKKKGSLWCLGSMTRSRTSGQGLFLTWSCVPWMLIESKLIEAVSATSLIVPLMDHCDPSAKWTNRLINFLKRLIIHR